MRSVSKVLHPDLRLAFLAGDETTVARVEGRQWLGPRWVSHILQATVASLLADPGFSDIAGSATEAYTVQTRRAHRCARRPRHPAHGRSGLNVWIPVPEEAPVLSAVLDAGWLVLAGERCRLATRPAIRVTTATLAPGDAPAVAEAIAGAHGRRRAY